MAKFTDVASPSFILANPEREPVTLRDGTPFFDKAEVGVMVKGWPDLILQIGVQDGEPVVNRVVIERKRGPLVGCSNPDCDFTSSRPISSWTPAPQPPFGETRIEAARRQASAEKQAKWLQAKLATAFEGYAQIGVANPSDRPELLAAWEGKAQSEINEIARVAPRAPEPDSAPCPQCHKGALAVLPTAAGPNGEVFSGPGFTATELHNIPWERLWTAAIDAMVQGAYRVQARTEVGEEPGVPSRRRRWRITPDLLRRVAEIVAANPDAPTRAVADKLPTSYRNATRLIARAKE